MGSWWKSQPRGRNGRWLPSGGGGNNGSGFLRALANEATSAGGTASPGWVAKNRKSKRGSNSFLDSLTADVVRQGGKAVGKKRKR